MDLNRLRYAWIFFAVAFFALTIVTIVFTALVSTRRLPVPTATIVLSWLLPVVQLGQCAWLLCSAKIRVNITIGVAWIMSILDGVLIALAAYQNGPQVLDCSLEHTWRQWFQNKDANAIRQIQNLFQCCGLRSPVDQAWPFPDSDHDATACRETYQRGDSCYDGWSQATGRALFGFVAVGIVSLALKVLLSALLQLRTSPSQSSHTQWRSSAQERRALLSSRQHEESYSDEAPADVEADR